MVRFAAVFAWVALAAAPGALQAQDPVLAAPDARVSGVWQLDAARSDSLPAAAAPMAAAMRGGGAGMAGGMQGRGGGGAGRGGGGGRGAGRGGGGAGGPGGAEGMPELLADMAPVQMTITVEPARTMIVSDTATAAFTWQTDKKKRQVALPKGGLIEVEASWWMKTLQTIRKVDGNTELKKEFKVNQDGNELEVKVNAKIAGKKTEAKLRYTRVS